MRLIQPARPRRSAALVALCAFLARATVSYAQTFALPAPGLDLALSPSGVAVASTSGASLAWVRAVNGAARNVPFDPFDFSVLVNSTGTTAYFGARTSPNLVLLDLGTDQPATRSYTAVPTDIALTPDDKFILTGLNNKTVLITDTVYFQDLATLSLSGLPRSIVVTPDNKFAFVATGPSGKRIAKIDLTTRTVVKQIDVNTSISKLAVSPDGKRLYAVASLAKSGSPTKTTLEVFYPESGKRAQTVALSLSGSQATTFDIEAGTTSVFISSTVPFKVSGKTAGVVRLPIQGGKVSKPRLFSNKGAGARAISLDQKGKKLGIINSSGMSVTFLKIP